MPPVRGSSVSSATGAQAFIDSMLIGENLRRARAEAAQNERIGQQTIDINEQSKQINDQNLETGTFRLEQGRLQAELDAQARAEAEFNALQEKKRSLAQGLEVVTSGGFITDIKDPTGKYKRPVGTLTTQTARGPVSVSSEEAEQIRQVEGRRRQFDRQTTREDSADKAEGSILAAEIAQRNRLAIEEIQTQRALNLEEIRGERAKTIADNANTTRLEAARIAAGSKNQPAEPRLAEDYAWAEQGLGDGSLRTIDLGRSGFSKEEIRLIQRNLHQKGYKNLTASDLKTLNKDRAAAATLSTQMSEYRNIVTELSNSSNPGLANIQGMYENVKGSIWPSEVYKKFETLGADVRRRIADVDARPSDKDAAAEELANISLLNTPEENNRRIDRIFTLLGGGIRAKYNVNPAQFSDMFSGTAFENYEVLQDEYNATKDAVTAEQVQPESLEQIRQNILNDPSWIDQIEREGSTVEKEAKLLFDGQNSANKSKNFTNSVPVGL